MSLITRYILRSFIATVAVSLMAFAGIFYVVDLIQQLDKFLDRQVEPAHIVLYYVYYLPYILVLTIPVAMLLASLFTLGQLARYGELTAMKASGLSLYRILRPMLGISVIVCLSVFAAGEWIVPETNYRRSQINMDHVEKRRGDDWSVRNNILFRGEDGRQYYFRLYNSYYKKASEVFISEFREGAVIRTIMADEMEWENGGWTLRHGALQDFHPRGPLLSQMVFDSLSFPQWAERPEDFQKDQKQPDEMNYGELQQYIRNVERGGGDAQGYLVDLNLKIAFPCASLIIVLFGGSLAAHVRRSGAAMGFALSIGVCFLYWGMLRFSQALGHAESLSPVMAAWGPNAIFFALGLLLLLRAPK